MIFSFLSFKNADLLDRMLINIGKKLLFIAFGDRDVLLVEHNASAVYHLDLALLNDERAVYTNELVGRQVTFPSS